MKKINKLLMTTAIVAFAFSAAANAQVSVKNFTGPSVEVGVQVTNTKLTLGADTYNGLPVGISEINRNHTDYLPKLSAQYGFETPVNNLVIGLGASYTPGTSSVHFNTYGESSEFTKINRAKSLYIQPMYALNEATAIFGKLSYNKIDSKVYFNGADDLYAIGSKTISGKGLGVGVTHFVTKDLFLKAEIESIYYGNNAYDTYWDLYEAKTQQTNSTISLGVKF
jgi:opacity protein-like surface antigen